MAHERSILSEMARITIPVVILAAGVAGFFVFSSLEKAPGKVVEEEKPPLVETEPVAAHEGGLEFEVDGVVVPFREITLSAEVDGRIAYKNDVCRAGEYVERDTLLFRVDPRDYQLEVDRLTEELNQADNALKELQVEIENAGKLVDLSAQELELLEDYYQRQKQLRGDRVVSDSELDTAERNVLQARNAKLTVESQWQLLKTRRRGVEAAMKRGEVQLKKAVLDLERTEIRSPDDTDGVFVSDLVEQGDYVRKGTALVTIEDTSKAEVKCSLRMDELCWLWSQAGESAGELAERGPLADYEIPQAPVTVIYELAGREYQWSGTLSRYDGIGLDEKTRTVPCRVVVDAPRRRQVRVHGSAAAGDPLAGPPALVRGMYVTVRIHAQPQANLLRVDEAAVWPGNKVSVVRDGRLSLIDVDVVRVTGGAAIVRAGRLRAGDRVVVTPLAMAENGMSVREHSGK
jgi:multidrug efflux pump subunit AcrA (membrane-fusion protein)